MIEPTTEHWHDLHTSFREFCLATPWQWLDDSDPLAIEHPSGHYTGYCAVMGSGGHEYSLAVLVGDEGLSAYMALMTDEIEPESTDVLVRMNALSAILADREDLDDRDRATIRRLGLRYRGGAGGRSFAPRLRVSRRGAWMRTRPHSSQRRSETS